MRNIKDKPCRAFTSTNIWKKYNKYHSACIIKKLRSLLYVEKHRCLIIDMENTYDSIKLFDKSMCFRLGLKIEFKFRKMKNNFCKILSHLVRSFYCTKWHPWDYLKDIEVHLDHMHGCWSGPVAVILKRKAKKPKRKISNTQTVKNNIRTADKLKVSRHWTEEITTIRLNIEDIHIWGCPSYGSAFGTGDMILQPAARLEDGSIPGPPLTWMTSAHTLLYLPLRHLPFSLPWNFKLRF